MNGTGKGGIHIDASGQANFAAKVGTVVGLSLWSFSGLSTIGQVAYGGKSIEVQNNSFVVGIEAGIILLQIYVQRPSPENLELRDSSGTTVSQFDSDEISYSIKGE